MNRSINRIWLAAGEISLLFNLVLLISVVMNYDWVRTRAAGGGFDDFPTGIRAIYFAMTVFMFFLMFYLRDLHLGSMKGNRPRAARWITYLFLLSALTQLISRSPDERWNAIPALIIALSFMRAAGTKV